MTDVFELIKSRTSANHYDPAHKLSDEALEQLIELATCAPSAFNAQNWKFVAVRSDDAKARLRRLAGWRWGADGSLVVTSERHRSQAMNREDARDKLRALVLAALERPKPRRPTRPTLASVRRRLDGKAHRSAVKAGRVADGGDE